MPGLTLQRAMDDATGALADFVETHPGLFVLTGAGVSTASGIPGYRDQNGRLQRGAAA